MMERRWCACCGVEYDEAAYHEFWSGQGVCNTCARAVGQSQERCFFVLARLPVWHWVDIGAVRVWRTETRFCYVPHTQLHWSASRRMRPQQFGLPYYAKARYCGSVVRRDTGSMECMVRRGAAAVIRDLFGAQFAPELRYPRVARRGTRFEAWSSDGRVLGYADSAYEAWACFVRADKEA